MTRVGIKILSFVFLREEVILHEDWKAVGMIATSSHSFEVKKLRVMQNRSFTIDSRFAVLQEPVYRYPFLQFAEATLAVNSSGMAMRFLDLCGEIFFKSTSAGPARNDILPALQIQLEEARKELEERRAGFYEAVETSWQSCGKEKPVPPESLKQISEMSYKLARISLQVTDRLYPFCGMASVDPSSEINRVWRNLHTASQHALLRFPPSAGM